MRIGSAGNRQTRAGIDVPQLDGASDFFISGADKVLTRAKRFLSKMAIFWEKSSILTQQKVNQGVLLPESRSSARPERSEDPQPRFFSRNPLMSLSFTG
jgi:hypothetical protein